MKQTKNKKLAHLLSIISIAVISVFLFSSSPVQAAVVTWEGDESALWSVGGNWSNGSGVGAGDIATFDGTGNTACTIDGTASVAGIDINSGYTNTITQAAELTIGSSHFDIASGTFTGATQDITISGNVVIAGGIFNSTSGTISFSGDWTHTAGGEWNALTGTVKFTGYRETFNFDYPTIATSGVFNNFTYDSTSDSGSYVSLSGDTLYINGNALFYDGRCYNGAGIQVQGDVTIGPWDGYDTTDASLTFSGTGTQTFDLTGYTGSWDAHTIIGTGSNSPTVNLASDFIINKSTQDLTITNGSLNIGAYELEVVDDTNIAGGTLNGDTGTLDLYDVIITDGTLNGTTGDFNFSGDWTHTAGGIWNHNNGLVTFDGYRETFNSNYPTISSSGVFYNLTINNSGETGGYFSISTGDSIYVNNDLNFTNGRFNVGTSVVVQGDVTVASTWDGFNNTDAELIFAGSDPQTFDLTGGTGTINSNITIGTGSSTPTVNLVSDLIMNYGSQDLTVLAGTLNASTYEIEVIDDLTVSGGVLNAASANLDLEDLIITDGTFNAPTGTMYISGNWTHTAGGVFNNNSGTVMWDGAGAHTWNFDKASYATSGVFNNVTFDCNGTGTVCGGGSNYVSVSAGDTIYLDGDLEIPDGRILGSTSTIEVSGDVTIGANCYSYDTNDADLVFAGSSPQTFDLTGAEALFNSDISIGTATSTPTVNLVSNLTMDLWDQDLDIIEGTLNLNGYDIDLDNQSANHITVEDGGVFAWKGTETLALNSGDPILNSGSTVQYNPTTGTVSTQDWGYHHLAVASTGGAIVQLGTTEALAGDLSIDSGTFSLNGQSLSVTGTFSNDGALRLIGTESPSLTNDTDSGAIEYIGDNDSGIDSYTLGFSSYYGLIINSSDGADDTFQLASDTDIDGSLTNTAGTLDVTTNNYQINVAGNWANGGGTFNPRSGAVVLDGTSQAISGTNTFYKLTKQVGSADTLTLPASTTTTVSNLLTLQGNSTDQRLSLASSTPDTQFNIDPQGVRILHYLNVQDSNNANATEADCNKGCLSSDNNTNWSFYDISTYTTSSQAWHFTSSSDYTYNSSYIDIALDAGATYSRLKDLGGATYQAASLPGLSHRKPITITNSGSSLTDHQIELSITYDLDMQADFDDLRFTTSDGQTEIDYWIQDYTASTSATIWVEVPTIAATPTDTTIYMHYGNASTSTTSNIDNTFLFGDDFDDASVDTNKWTTTGILEETGGSLLMNATEGVWATNYIVEDDSITTFQAYIDVTGTKSNLGYVEESHQFEDDLDSGEKGFDFGFWTSTSLYFERGGSTYEESSVTYGTGWNEYTATYQEGTSIKFEYPSSSFTEDTATSVVAVSDAPHLQIYSFDRVDFRADYVFVRKYTSNTVGASLGSEEEVSYDNVQIIPVSVPAYANIISFTETLGAANAGSVAYQLSKNGTNWYYHNDSSWTAVSVDSVHNNTATEVDNLITNFTTDVGTGDLYFKAFLISSGSQKVELDAITLTYNAVPQEPTSLSPSTTDIALSGTASATISDMMGSHQSTSWKMQTGSDCSVDSGVAFSSLVDSTNKTSITYSGLDFSTSYYLCVANHNEGGQGDWQSQSFTTVANQAPTASAGTDITISEDDESTALDGTSSSDPESQALTYTWLETVDASDGCSLSSPSSSTPTVTVLNKDTSFNCTFSLEVEDTQGATSTDTVNLYITADNDAPAFGSIASTQNIDEESVLLISFTSSDPDTSSLTLSASNLPTGSTFTDNLNNTGTFNWSPDGTQSGIYTVTFQLTDGENTTTQTVTITVNDTVQEEGEGDEEEEEEPVNTIEDIGLVSGTDSGPGIVTLYGNDNEELCSVQAWNEGGAVPFRVRFLDTNYIAVVKNKTGTTIHLYDLNCNIIEKKRLSPKLHPRNIVTRNFLGKTTSQEIGLTSRRGSTVYGKIFRYNPNKDKWYLLRQKTFRPVPTGYNLKKTKKGNILLKKNNKTLHKWEI